MGFIENLAKGFVRSAVNQVGRDTGKVVSNKIYGNAHATPIKGISQSEGLYYDEGSDIPMSDADLAIRIYNEGYKVKYFNTNPFFKLIGWNLGGLASTLLIAGEHPYYAMIPPALLILVAICKIAIARKEMMIYRKKEIATYKRDNRYTSGKRFVGYTMGEVDEIMIPTKTFINRNWIIFSVYIVLAALMHLTALYLLSLENGDANGMWMIIGITSSIVFISLSIMHITFK